MATVQMYTTRWCGYCVRTELWQLDRSGELEGLAA